jgi:hypothetical protein
MPNDGTRFSDSSDVAGGPPGWVIVAAPNDATAGGSWAWLSTDGATWELLPIDAWSAARVERVVWWNDRFVASGTEGSGTDVHVAFWTSADGRAWDPIPDRPSFVIYQGGTVKDFVGDREMFGGRVEDLYLDGQNLVAEAIVLLSCECDDPRPAELWTTADTAVWDWRVSGFDDLLPHPIRTPSGTFFRTQLQTIEQSTDGKHWTTFWSPPAFTDAEVVDLTAYRDGFVGVGDKFLGEQQDALVVSSDDGVNSVESTGWPGFENGYMTSVAGFGDTVVAYGGANQAPYAWVSQPAP